MFCKYCGQMLSDDSVFCSKCGKRIENGTQADISATDNLPKIQTVSAIDDSAAVPDEKAISELLEYIEKQKKLKKKRNILFIVLASVLAVITAAGVFALSKKEYTENLFLQITKSDKDYFSCINKKDYEKISTQTSKLLNSDKLSKGIGGDSEIALSFSENGKKLLFDNLIKNEELKQLFSGFEEGGMDLDMVSADNKIGIDTHLILNDELIKTYIVLDSETGDIYIEAPDYTDQALKIHPDENSDIQAPNELVTVTLPSEEKMKNLLDKYFSIAFGKITKTESSKKTLTVGYLTQKSTCYTAIFDPQALYETSKALLEELKNDEDAKSLVEAFAAYSGKSAGEIYQMIDSRLEKLTPDTFKESGAFEYSVYVNGKGEVLARALTAKEKTYYCCTLKNENSFETVIGAGKKDAVFTDNEENDLYISGKGTFSENVINGDFSFKQKNSEILTLNISEFDKTVFGDKGIISGKFDLSPKKGFSESIKRLLPSNLQEKFESTTEAEKSADISGTLKIQIDTKQDGEISVKISDTNEELLSLTIIKNESNVPEIILPSSSVDNIQDWISSINVISLLKKTGKTDLPGSILEIIKELKDNINTDNPEPEKTPNIPEIKFDPEAIIKFIKDRVKPAEN